MAGIGTARRDRKPEESLLESLGQNVLLLIIFNNDTGPREAMPPQKEDAIRKKREVFAKNLRAARIEAGLTQNDVAKITGLTQAFLSLCETGNTNISLDNLVILSEVVHQPLCKLLASKE